MLFCIDFDKTIVNGHFNNILQTTGAAPGEPRNTALIEDLLSDPGTGLKNPTEMKELIQTSLANGHKVAITSYNQYREVFLPTLTRMGLSREEIAQIKVVSFLPEDQSIGKTPHMETAMVATGISDKSQVYLIDDSESNCMIAQSNGFNPIKVPEEANAESTYLRNPLEMAKQPVVQRITASPPRSSEILNLSEYMIHLQSHRGRDAASNLKQSIFRELQKDGLVPPGENIRNMPEYASGQAYIRARLNPEQTEKYYQLANAIVRKELSKTSGHGR